VPSKLPRTQGAVPHGMFLRSHSHVAKTESREKQGNIKLNRTDPPIHRHTSLHPLISGVSGTPPLALTGWAVALARPRRAHGPPRSPQISRCDRQLVALANTKRQASMAVINAKSSVANVTTAWHESYSRIPPAARACKGHAVSTDQGPPNKGHHSL
jgi:hypothetical protein